jgi:hypothetical protein
MRKILKESAYNRFVKKQTFNLTIISQKIYTTLFYDGGMKTIFIKFH